MPPLLSALSCIHQAFWISWLRLTLDSYSLSPKKFAYQILKILPFQHFRHWLLLLHNLLWAIIPLIRICSGFSPLCSQIHITNTQQALRSHGADHELTVLRDKRQASFFCGIQVSLHSGPTTVSSLGSYQPPLCLYAVISLLLLANFASPVKSTHCLRCSSDTTMPVKIYFVFPTPKSNNQSFANAAGKAYIYIYIHTHSHVMYSC